MINWWADLALVALGGGIGGALRHMVGVWFDLRLGTRLPWGTLTVNLSGAFLLGVLLGTGAGHRAAGDAWWLLLGVGVLGSYTTVSALSLQAVLMARDDRHGAAIVYVGTTMLTGLAAMFAGYVLGTLH